MSYKWDVVDIDSILETTRISLKLPKSYIIKLRRICEIIGVKQYSKAIKVMIDTYLYIKED